MPIEHSSISPQLQQMKQMSRQWFWWVSSAAAMNWKNGNQEDIIHIVHWNYRKVLHRFRSWEPFSIRNSSQSILTVCTITQLCCIGVFGIIYLSPQLINDMFVFHLSQEESSACNTPPPLCRRVSYYVISLL